MGRPVLRRSSVVVGAWNRREVDEETDWSGTVETATVIPTKCSPKRTTRKGMRQVTTKRLRIAQHIS